LSDSDDRHAFLNAAPRERKRLLRNRIAADFAAGRTVVVDGWVLAEAEALLAALVACYS
jgi:hypothetical protein